MGLWDKYFKTEHIECPRCLGKGMVDLDDIKRLNKSLYWAPGACAYCLGKGSVKPGQLFKVQVDEIYLHNRLTRAEREKFINGHPDAIENAEHYKRLSQELVDQIRYLSKRGKLSAVEIADFYNISKDTRSNTDEEEQDFLAYIENVIDVQL